MRNTQNITLGILCISATVLATLLAFTFHADRAGAAGIASSAGEYIMFTGEVTGSMDLLYIVDLTKRKMNVYAFQPMENTIVLRDQVDLAKTFREAPK